MVGVVGWTIGSVLIVSLISLIGIITLGMNEKRLSKWVVYLISFSAGALLGDVFLHLLPEIVEENGFGFNISGMVLLGVLGFFVLEKVLHWRHCHGDFTGDKNEGHVHAFAWNNVVGDGFHNLLDGVIIAGAYLVSIPVGVATTFAVIMHEIPQEIGDFAVLIHGGFSKGKALLVNLGSALMSVLGAVIVLALNGGVEGLERILVPLAAGGFLYIAGSDLIPEIHKHSDSFWKGLGQFVGLLLGMGVMVGLLFLG
jgi:zinc and cadmium transporter